MTYLRPVTKIGLLLFGALALAATSCSQTPKRPAVAEQIAKTYGLDSFGQIEAIRYTFNLEVPGLNLSRSGVWEPKTGQVSSVGKDKDGKPVKATYVRSQLSSQSDAVKNEIDPAFINDQYWLVFPFHVYWDTSAQVQDMGTQESPLAKRSAKRVVLKYPSEGGYQPGDTWELYLGTDNRVQEILYRRGGPQPPSLVIATYEGYKKAGPLLVSTDHSGTADGKPLRLSLSNVAVKLTGSDAWAEAQ